MEWDGDVLNRIGRREQGDDWEGLEEVFSNVSRELISVKGVTF